MSGNPLQRLYWKAINNISNPTKMSQTETVFRVMKEAAKPLRSSEIMELSGLDKSTVDKAMKELKDTEVIFSPKRCFWQAR